MLNTFIKTKAGIVEIIGTPVGINQVRFVQKVEHDNTPTCLTEAKNQLSEYFNGTRHAFDLDLVLQGTEFQHKVWNALLEIPYGETRSYQEIAEAIGNPKAVRAVGMANNKNNIGIIIPCHRVIGKDGSMTGYYGGIHYKEFLLDLERKNKE